MSEEVFTGRDLEIEQERYEFFEPLPYRFDFARRDFLKALGGGVVVVSVVTDALAQRRGGGRFGGRDGRDVPQELGAWIHIGEDGTITAYTGKVELGQNIRTSLAQGVAEELRVPLSSVRFVMADTDLVPPDAGTFGSRTTPQMLPQVRRAANAARELLKELAAAKWNVEATSLKVADGRVTNPETTESASFGELTKGQKLTKTIADGDLTTPQEWQALGQPATKVNGRDIVTGRHRYASDIDLPNLVHGKVLRPAALGAELTSVDLSAAEAMPSVTVVRDGEFVGVAAPTEQMASRALQAIRADWKTSPQVGRKQLFAHLKQSGGGSPRATDWNAAAAIKNDDGNVKLERSYTVAYIAHAPLEPRAAVAEWQDDKLTVWTGSQRPFQVRRDLAQTFRVSEDRVRVIVPDTGSGYGGKQSSEMAIEAARLARATNKPVKLVWTREEEFTWAYFRPAGVIDISSAARPDGKVTGWEMHNYNSGGAGVRSRYDFADERAESHRADSPLRQGSYRALASTANHFARETHIDELAHELKIEPLEFRLKNIRDERLRAVLEATAKAFGRGPSKPAENHGFGIACGFEKSGYIATAAEVAVNRASGDARVVRVAAAFDCGAVINPNGLKNQIEGCLVMGLGGALFEEILFEDGKILNARFARYRVPRFSDTPKIDVVLVDRKDLPSAGGSESPIVCIAPAVGNAIFNATGVRLRSLPLVPKGLKA